MVEYWSNVIRISGFPDHPPRSRLTIKVLPG